ncbi:hypothetical protein CBR_g38676 [Chara braunii]|uniref:Uncharacterized protein n=1 Tax=Chara braunii TaxID=69332 RepID=A0A388K0L5_CHABU|nr:hypothetical protein CBR_g38676 [Chara braunii]|eukprot:GBG63610.1 hypothetical protein CBR_g38676 [Chara braunii]
MSNPPPEAQQLRIRETWKEKGVVVDLGGEDDEPLERRRLRSATQATTAAVSTARAADDERPITGALPCTPSLPRQRNDGGDGASRQRGGGGGVVADARAAGGEAAGGAGVAVAGVVPPVPAAREEATVPATVREEGRGQNTNQRDGGEAASSRARRGHEGGEDRRPITAPAGDLPCSVHGWVFKYGNRPRGYNLAFQYSLESIATDIARAMWYDEEWRNVVSVLICARTIDVNMDLPLWYDGANIEDRPEDDDMAVYQESTVISIAHSFRVAVQMGAHIDGDFISYERLCRVADCFRLLLAASMWITRMAGDDPRSHYEVFYFADLSSAPRTSSRRGLGRRKSRLECTPTTSLIGHHATSDLRTTRLSGARRMRRG